MFKKIISLFLLCFSATVYSAQSLQVPAELVGKTITVVVPYGPGGSSDVLARTVANKVTEQTGVNTIVLNKPGAGGAIGASYVARSHPDGLTVCHCDTGPSMVNTMLKVPDSPAFDALVPVSAILESIVTVTVAGDSPFNTLQELTAHIKKNPQAVSYASIGAITVLWSEELMSKVGATGAQPIPYKSMAEAISSVIRKETLFIVAGAGDVTSLAKAGRVKVLAVGSQKRLNVLADIPTIDEIYPKMYMRSLHGIYVPKGTSPTIQKFLNEAWSNAVWNGDTIATFRAKGIVPVGGDLKRAKLYYDESFQNRIELIKAHGTKIIGQ